MSNILHEIGSIIATGLIAIAGIFSPLLPSTGATIPVTTAVFSTSLATSISASDTSMTLVSGTDKSGDALSGYTCFTIDEGTALEEFVCGTASGTSISSMIRGIDPVDGDLEVTSLKKDHRRSASVKITNYPSLGIISRILNGDETLPNIITYASAPTFTGGSNQLASIKYVDDTAFAGAPDASTIQKGVAEEATEAEINAGTAAGGTSARLFVNPSTLATSNYGVYLPTSGQKDGLAGNGGTVGSSNTFVTQQGLQEHSETYGGASAVGTDSYAVTLSPALSAYTNGQILGFEADVANTGAATIDFGPGAKTIKKYGNTTDLGNGDIAAGQVVWVVYDSGSDVMQMLTIPATNTDSNNSNTSFFAGPGNATTVKSYNIFHIPWLVTTDVPTANVWTVVNNNSVFNYNFVQYQGSADSTNSLLTTQAIGAIMNGTSPTDLAFSHTKLVVAEFEMERGAVGTEQMGWGFSTSNAPFIDYDDASVDAAAFTVDASGNLYCHTSNGNGTTNHTETAVTGITLTDKNTYRIEVDPAQSEVRCYVNGILKATNTTNLPNGGSIKFGLGAQGTSNGDSAAVVGPVWFAVEK